MRLNIESLVCDLPEDVLKKKWAGDFEGEKRSIDARLAAPGLNQLIRDRLTLERALIDRLPGRFPYTRAQAIEIMRGRARDFSESEFDALEDEGCVDFIHVNGERKYLRSFAGTLIRMKPGLRARAFEAEAAQEPSLDEAISEMKSRGELAYRFGVSSALTLSDEAFTPGEKYTAHLPVPAVSAQQPEAEISIKAEYGGFVSPPDACQRTVCYTRALNENTPFKVEYAFVNRMKYVDASGKPFIAYPNAGAPVPDDLSEQSPHIMFTPLLRALARDIAGGETNALRAARKFYDYITQNVRYSFMRSYILIDRHAEYCALNLKGDCGIQAILFITLCRIAGIPARWQSGLTMDKKSTGNHDWAQFYTPEFGWLFCDPSFGGSAWRAGAIERHDFYFGNLDPFRMIANRRYQTNFVPPKAFERFDPYDNQDGEIESARMGFDSTQYDTQNHTTLFEKL